ncbi:MAG: sialidase family protein [Rhodospirillales bacterium]
MQYRLTLAAALAMGIACGNSGSGAMAADGEGGEPSVAAIEAARVSTPQDRKDVPIAADPGKAELSQAIAANPKNPARLVAVISRGLWSGPCFAVRSSDGGRTWSQPVALPPARALSCSGADVAFAPDGSRVYAAYNYDDASEAMSILVSTSKDNGANWDDPIVALQGDPNYWYYSMPRLAAPLGEQDAAYVYVTARRDAGEPSGDFVFTRSNDFGTTWSTPQRFAGYDEDNHVSANVTGGAAGDVLVVWSNTDDFFTDPESSNIKVMRSGDYGQTFAAPVIAAKAPFHLINGVPDIKVGTKGAAHIVYSRYRNTNYDGSDVQYTWSAGPPYTTGRNRSTPTRASPTAGTLSQPWPRRNAAGRPFCTWFGPRHAYRQRPSPTAT